MRAHVLRWLGWGWPGDAIRQAPTVAEAIQAGQAAHNAMTCAGPHLPKCAAGPHGVTYRRADDGLVSRMTWREVALALRTGSLQASLLP